MSMRFPEAADLPEIPGLPNVLRDAHGAPIRDEAAWRRRRPEIAAMLEHYAYGHMPAERGPVTVDGQVEQGALDGTAVLTRATLRVGPRQELPLRVSLYAPAGGGPHPVVLNTDAVDHPAFDAAARALVKRGYALAGYQRHDLDADNADRSDGVHPLYPSCDWATLAVWAWGAMCTLDYLLAIPSVDWARVIVTGHSRGGKTALLAAALDERIAMAAPHASGAGGAGCWRLMGHNAETLELITSLKRFGYWFHPRLATFGGRVARLPFDQHYLKALVAPRPLLCVEALDDLWANPLGTQRTNEAVRPVYELLGAGERVAYYWRPIGGHDLVVGDWLAIADYADLVLCGRPGTRDWRSLPFS